MSLAASLLVLAAAAAPQAAQPAAPAPAARHGVVVTANATAVILRPAIISFDPAKSPAGQRDAIYRQTSHRGRQVLIEFN